MKNKIITLEELEYDVYMNEKQVKDNKPRQKTMDDFFCITIVKRNENDG